MRKTTAVSSEISDVTHEHVGLPKAHLLNSTLARMLGTTPGHLPPETHHE